jgi:hypothetical protein
MLIELADTTQISRVKAPTTKIIRLLNVRRSVGTEIMLICYIGPKPSEGHQRRFEQGPCKSP